MAPEVQTTTTMTSTAHGAHATPDHGTEHGHDNRGHAADTLGPIDWKMWGAGLVAVAAALAVLVGFVLATGFSFNA